MKLKGKIFICLIFVFLSYRDLLSLGIPLYEISSTDDSSTSSYSSYDKIIFCAGYNKSDYEESFLLQSEYFLYIGYRISSFFNSLDVQETQVGLFNEFGLNNLAVYFDAGPELRILHGIYIIPYGGISFALTNYGVGFLPYMGVRTGYIKNISGRITFEFEVGTQLVLIDTKLNNKYIKIGIGINLL
jgi:hypothetical protein